MFPFDPSTFLCIFTLVGTKRVTSLNKFLICGLASITLPPCFCSFNDSGVFSFCISCGAALTTPVADGGTANERGILIEAPINALGIGGAFIPLKGGTPGGGPGGMRGGPPCVCIPGGPGGLPGGGPGGGLTPGGAIPGLSGGAGGLYAPSNDGGGPLGGMPGGGPGGIICWDCCIISLPIPGGCGCECSRRDNLENVERYSKLIDL